VSGFKSGLKFGAGFALSVVVIAFILTGLPELISKYDDVTAMETWEPEVEISELNHWSSGDKIVFVGKLSNQADHDWRSLAVHFKVKDDKQKFMGTCSDVIYGLGVGQADLAFEAKCYDMPSKLENYSFESSFFGRY